MLLENRIAVVTGGSQGLGKSIAEMLIKEGASVISGDIQIAAGEHFQATDGERFFESHLNITNRAEVRELFAAVHKRFGRLDILVNNAGICRPITPFAETEDDVWLSVMNTNVMGMVNCTREAIPYMKAQRYGRIISLGSVAGQFGGYNTSASYSASKASIHCITKVLARELGPFDITVNSVAPGFMISEMTKDHKHDTSAIPLRRLGEACEVAGSVLFLASELASYVTGVTLDVNGGVLMR